MVLPVRRIVPVLLAATLVAGVSGCAKSTSASTTPAAGAATGTPAAATSPSATAAGACEKVRFALHAGLGAGAVHRYLLKPYQAGTFASGAAGRKTAIVKGALAAAFAYHEFHVALTDIAPCPSVQALTAAVEGGLHSATGLVTGLKSGTVNPQSVTGLNSQISTIESTAKTNGINVQEQDPTAVQLATDDTGN